ncbi:unnamed protein product [Cyprideis torosa]|uniref:Uncharacterized protein n=1 Tax=Cyprideis torosa TaxID=163714 RepID=A0A7R8WMP8_9CRUS|nr:unnamed protein product [Cyprideis torosa]CAG0903905.1 unnamed protein product [Cyprideis torosa]
MLVFPGFRTARMHWTALEYAKESPLTTVLLTLSFISPLALIWSAHILMCTISLAKMALRIGTSVTQLKDVGESYAEKLKNVEESCSEKVGESFLRICWAVSRKYLWCCEIWTLVLMIFLVDLMAIFLLSSSAPPPLYSPTTSHSNSTGNDGTFRWNFRETKETCLRGSLGRCIFLFETSGRSFLLPHEICAIESAANLHPDWTLFVLTHQPLKLLPKVPNVRFALLDAEEFLKDSLVHNWWVNFGKSETPHFFKHVSDVAKYLLLYDALLKFESPHHEFLKDVLLSLDRFGPLETCYDCLGVNLLNKMLNRMCPAFSEIAEIQVCSKYEDLILFPPHLSFPLDPIKASLLLNRLPHISQALTKKLIENQSMFLHLRTHLIKDFNKWMKRSFIPRDSALGNPMDSAAFPRLFDRDCLARDDRTSVSAPQRFVRHVGLKCERLSQFESGRFYVLFLILFLRLVTMSRYLQAYLNLAYQQRENQKREAGNISNHELKRSVARVFYYLCVVALQYLVPALLVVFQGLLLKSMGGYNWIPTSESGQCPAVDVVSTLRGESELPSEMIKEMELNAAQQVQLSLSHLRMVFSEEVIRGVLTFTTWWTAFAWFSSSAVGILYCSYFSQT